MRNGKATKSRTNMKKKKCMDSSRQKLKKLLKKLARCGSEA